MSMKFEDRREAGRLLAKKLLVYRNRSDVALLALPRGGVPVAFEVARELGLPLDILVVRKLGVPGHEEYAFGSIASGGVSFVNREVADAIGLNSSVIQKVIDREKSELQRREQIYRNGRPSADMRNKTVIIVDDGLATGSTMRSAVDAVRARGAKEIVVAVPVSAPQTCAELQNRVDTWCVCVQTPEPFYAVGMWYRNFDQTTDDEVRRLLAAAARPTLTRQAT